VETRDSGHAESIAKALAPYLARGQ